MIVLAARGDRHSRSRSKVRAYACRGEQRVPVDEIEQRHGLAFEDVDDVPIVDDMTAPAIGMGPAARERHQMGRSEEDLEPVVRLQTVTARRAETRPGCGNRRAVGLTKRLGEPRPAVGDVSAQQRPGVPNCVRKPDPTEPPRPPDGRWSLPPAAGGGLILIVAGQGRTT